jgi:hypothetical protein
MLGLSLVTLKLAKSYVKDVDQLLDSHGWDSRQAKKSAKVAKGQGHETQNRK